MTARLLVVDLAATSKNWALTPDGERRLRSEAPPGWHIHVVIALPLMGTITRYEGDIQCP